MKGANFEKMFIFGVFQKVNFLHTTDLQLWLFEVYSMSSSRQKVLLIDNAHITTLQRQPLIFDCFLPNYC